MDRYNYNNGNFLPKQTCRDLVILIPSETEKLERERVIVYAAEHF